MIGYYRTYFFSTIPGGEGTRELWRFIARLREKVDLSHCTIIRPAYPDAIYVCAQADSTEILQGLGVREFIKEEYSLCVEAKRKGEQLFYTTGEKKKTAPKKYKSTTFAPDLSEDEFGEA